MNERTPFEQVMIGGNHLANALLRYIGGQPWHDDLAALREWEFADVLERYGQPVADMWVAWKAIMDLRDSEQPEPRRCPVCGCYQFIYKGDRQVCADCGRE